MSHALRASLIAIALIAAAGQTACFGGGPSPSSLRKSPEFQLRPPGSAVLAESNFEAGILGSDATAIDLSGSKMDLGTVEEFYVAMASEKGWPEVESFPISGFQYANAWKVGAGLKLSVNVGQNSRAEQFPGYQTLFQVTLSAVSKKGLDESIRPTTATMRPR